MIIWNDILLRLLDPLLGWLLLVPRAVALFQLALLTALIILTTRWLATDQDLLERCARDKKRLRLLNRVARRAGDRAARLRHRATLSAIALRQAQAEVRPLLLALLPVTVLAIWASQRLAYLPPRLGQDVLVTIYAPVSAEGRLAHLVPMDTLDCPTGWVQRLRPSADHAYSSATWTLRSRLSSRASQDPYTLSFRYAGATYSHLLRIGASTYAPPITPGYDGKILALETHLQESRLLGFIGGIPALSLPAWLTGYFLLSIPLVLLAKRALHLR